jgi:EAL domain-containing protein (putative c-di-GMP-specific phosphodiesterase class I)
VLNWIVASTRPHFDDIAKLSVRDSELVIATALLMCALSWYTGRQDLHRILAASPTAAQHVTLEITEDVFIARAADAIQASIASFRDLGVRIFLDDFGTGFASFHHLRQLDFDELKIDTSFVAGLGHDLTSEVLVRGFLNIASGIGVSVIAEGVETQAQSQELINMGCVAAQGYLFSPAVSRAQAAELFTPQKTA